MTLHEDLDEVRRSETSMAAGGREVTGKTARSPSRAC